MVELFLKLGTIDKKLILIILSTVIYIIMDIIDYFSEMSTLHFILDNFFARAISYIMIIIVPLIQKFKNKNLRIWEKDRSCTQIALDLFYLYLAYLLYFGTVMWLSYLRSKDPEDTEDYKMTHYKGFCSEEAIEIIFIIIVSKFLLKMKLYVHHYIGLLIFLILSLGIDLLFKLSIFKPDIFFIFIYILHQIFDSIYITYEKYMMDKLSYSPYTVVFSLGCFFLFGGILSVIIVSLTGGLFYDGKKYQIESFKDYFANNDYKEVIFHMIYIIIFRFFVNILKILTVYYFSPIHTFASYIVIKIFYLLLRKDAEYKFYSLILFVFQFISLLIFLEIIEINICNLDKDTKRNISRREIEENKGLLKLQTQYIEGREFDVVSSDISIDNGIEIISERDNEEDSRKTFD